jgi:hypothetical protein
MEELYYYLNSDNQSVGPIRLAAIRTLVASGIIDESVRIRINGSEEWQPLELLTPAPSLMKDPASPRTPPPFLRSVPGSRSTSGRSAATNRDPLRFFPQSSVIGGITSLMLTFSPLASLAVSMISVIVGAVALSRVSERNKSVALTGVLISSFSLVVSLFFLSPTGGGAENREGQAIERVLKSQIDFVHDANEKFPESPLEQLRFLASRLKSIDVTGCPPDFRLAYQRYLNSIDRSLPYIAADTPINSFIEGLYAGFTEDYTSLGATNYQARIAIGQIEESFREVLNSAAFYGARMPSR